MLCESVGEENICLLYKLIFGYLVLGFDIVFTSKKFEILESVIIDYLKKEWV